ncbi:hypothetical protein ACRAKI_18850 [Saccharothrix isguenensis]
MKYGARARGWPVPSRAEYDEWTRGARSIFAGNPEEVAERLTSVGGMVDVDRYAMQMDWSGVPHRLVMEATDWSSPGRAPSPWSEPCPTTRPSPPERASRVCTDALARNGRSGP